MIVCGYTLGLYCENVGVKGRGFYAGCSEPNEYPWEYTSDEKNCKQVCFRKAKQDGWRLTKDGKAFCPVCAPGAAKQTNKEV